MVNHMKIDGKWPVTAIILNSATPVCHGKGSIRKCPLGQFVRNLRDFLFLKRLLLSH